MRRNLTIIASAVLVVLLVFFLAFDLYRASRNEVLSRFNERQLLLAQQIANKMESNLRARSRAIRVLSSFKSMQSHRDRMKKMPTDVEAYFTYMKKLHVKDISVLDEKGTVIYSTNKDFIGFDYSRYQFFDWVKKKENKGKVFVSPLIQNTRPERIPPDFLFLIITPLYQEARDASHSLSGKFIGALSCTLDLKKILTEQLAALSSTIKPQYQVWVMDREGTLLFQSEHPEMTLRNIHRVDKTCKQCHTSFDYAQKMLIQKQGKVNYMLKNAPRKIAAFATMEFENVSWVVVVNALYDEVTAFVRKALIKTLLLLGVVVIALVGGAIRMYLNYRLKIRAEEEAKQWREKRALEDQVRESEERYRRLVELSPDAIIIHREGKIVFVNTAGLKLLGAKEAAEIIGKPMLEIVHPDFRNIVRKRIQTVSEGRNEVPRMEEKYVRLDGTEVDVEVVAIPFNYQGKPAVQVVAHDITSRKQAEEKIFQQLNELQRWHALTLEREDRIQELKREVNQLLKRLGEPIRYPSQEPQTEDKNPRKTS